MLESSFHASAINASKSAASEFTACVATASTKSLNVSFLATKSGVVSYIHGGGRIGVIVEAETSVVNDAVKEALTNLAMQIAALSIRVYRLCCHRFHKVLKCIILSNKVCFGIYFHYGCSFIILYNYGTKSFCSYSPCFLFGMMDCKKALNETNGDMDAAVEFLRKNGQAKAEKKAGRIAAAILSVLS